MDGSNRADFFADTGGGVGQCLDVDLAGEQAGEEQVASAAEVLDLAFQIDDLLRHWLKKITRLGSKLIRRPNKPDCLDMHVTEMRDCGAHNGFIKLLNRAF